MTAVFATQIELDERGVAWIAGTNTKVIEIVLDKIAYGWSPEEMHFQHPHLSLAEIHAALTWYYENQAMIDGQISRNMSDADRIAAQLTDPVIKDRLKHSA